MLEILRKFFTLENYAIRGMRLFFVALGGAFLTGVIPLPEAWSWVGGIFIFIGATITSGSAEVPLSGIPTKASIRKDARRNP